LKLRREFILGAVGVITLLLFIWGFNYLKGKDLFKKQQRFYVVYPVIDGLIESHPVTVNGVAIGQVNRIGFHKDRSGRVVVECLIGDYIDIPSNSIALLKSSSLIGGFEIELLLGNTPDYLQHGDTLTGEIKPLIQDELLGMIEPVKVQAVSVITRLDTLLASLNLLFNENTRSQINSGLHQLDKSLAHIESIAANIRDHEDTIANILENFSAVSDTLASLEFSPLLKQTNETLQSLSNLLHNLEAGEGTAGMLLNNEDLYLTLEASTKQLEYLLEDIRNNPKKYFSFSVFGK
jgi:phospholipid/cholesterol/gamma-HCH transport system substrate-binding protein